MVYNLKKWTNVQAVFRTENDGWFGSKDGCFYFW